MIKKPVALALLFIFALSFQVSSQSRHDFRKDVQTIRSYDEIYHPPVNPILFVGSSSIRKWPDLQKTFCKYVVLDRGIGGAVINDIIEYANDLIFKYHPKQVVIYVGENDVPHRNVTPDSILYRFENLFHLIRDSLPEVPVDFISMKPSPVRERFFPKEIQANRLIRQFLKGQLNARYIDIYPLMVTADGKARPDLFGEDRLHMNQAGYSLWVRKLKPYLIGH